MLCCAGLIAGFYIGLTLEGVWSFITPALGFVLGLIGDMKLLRGRHH